VILSHFQNLGNFRDFYSLFEIEVEPWFFIKWKKGLDFFEFSSYSQFSSSDISIKINFKIEGLAIVIEYPNQITESFFKQNQKDGFSIILYQNQERRGFFKNGKREGFHHIHYPDYPENFSIGSFFKDDFLHGFFYEIDGGIEKGFFENNLKQGYWIMKRRETYEEGCYHNGQKVGYWIEKTSNCLSWKYYF